MGRERKIKRQVKKTKRWLCDPTSKSISPKWFMFEPTSTKDRVAIVLFRLHVETGITGPL